MLEWLKRHAWKACKRQKRFGGSNPPHSAKRNDLSQVIALSFCRHSTSDRPFPVSAYTAETGQPQADKWF